MEALTHGVPVILLCNKSGEHASEIIPARDWHYKKMNKNCTSEELVKEIEKFKMLTYTDRLGISEETKKKHSKENWTDKIIRIYERSINNES